MNDGLDLRMFRRRSVKLVRQTEAAECGLACLAMVANHHGLDVDLATLRRRLLPSARGATLKALMAMADVLDLTPRPVKATLDQLGKLHLPAILHWDMNHFVVLDSVRGEKAEILDPAGRLRSVSLDEVSDHYTGVALELRPADDFEPSEHRTRLRLAQLWKRIGGLKRAMIQTVVLSIVMQTFVLASPYYMQVALDDALPSLDADLLTVLATGFALFTLLNAAATLLRSFVLLSAGTSLGFGIASNVARRLFRLPVAWFERRHVGDVLSRFQSINPIRQFLTEGAIAAALDGSLAVLTFVVMIYYSALLASVALVAFGLYAAVRRVSFAAQRRAQENAIMTGGKEQSTMIESLRGIVTLRLYNKETSRHSLWQSRLTDSMNAAADLTRITAWQTVANTLIIGLETVLSVWLAIRMVIAGGFSVGMVFAFLAYKAQFLQKGASLIDQGIAYSLLSLHLERLSDIALAEVDPSFEKTPERSNAEFRGRIELRDISFRYSPSEPFVIEGLNLVVEPGEHVAITGPSGGGKSTLLKILLGLVEPEHGEVLIDGQPIAQFGYKNFHDQIGAVLQEDNLFAGTLAENIALFDEIPEMDRIIQAADAAAVGQDVAAMPMGYETLVGDMGSTLSGGQRQRILLARAIYRRPKLLIMDEGTSHLDPSREQAVNAAVAKLGITRIIVAHGIETIIAADRIFATTRGKLEEITASMAPIKEQLQAARPNSPPAA